jgi:DNA polymerase/3'-5' exonuclease PolX
MSPSFSPRNRDSLGKKVVHEAAVLLYTLQEKEYKQAKERAAANFGTRMLPTNIEVAEELDKIAEENEGTDRKNRIILMRNEALRIMETLAQFDPKLVGSVWRGTAHRSSDIDITVFSSDHNQVVERLNEKGYHITRTEFVTASSHGKTVVSFHVFMILSSGNEAEIVVRDPEQKDVKVRCEIYGDIVRGLSLAELRKVLNEDPLRTFLPRRKA